MYNNNIRGEVEITPSDKAQNNHSGKNHLQKERDMNNQAAKNKDIEQQIMILIIDAAFAAGHTVSVHDGEEVTVEQSLDKEEILAACRSTGQDYLILKNKGERVGQVSLIYGNGNSGMDLISDYSTSIEDLMEPVMAAVEKFSEE